MYKRSGGRFNETSRWKECYHCMMPCVRSWKLRYFTVTDNGILYTSKSKTFEIKDMLLYCFKFTIFYGLFKTGRELGLVIESSTRRLRIESDTLFNLILLVVAIRNALNDSPFAEKKKIKFEKYGSFAPIRNHCSSKFYADGK
jgi:phospholipase D1/2